MRFLLIDEDGAAKLTEKIIFKDLEDYATGELTSIIDLQEAKYLDIDGFWVEIGDRPILDVNKLDVVFVPVGREPINHNEPIQEVNESEAIDSNQENNLNAVDLGIADASQEVNTIQSTPIDTKTKTKNKNKQSV